MNYRPPFQPALGANRSSILSPLLFPVFESWTLYDLVTAIWRFNLFLACRRAAWSASMSRNSRSFSLLRFLGILNLRLLERFPVPVLLERDNIHGMCCCMKGLRSAAHAQMTPPLSSTVEKMHALATL